MDLDFTIMRWAMRRWRPAALLVLLLVPGAMGLYLQVTTDHVMGKLQPALDSLSERLLPTPAPISSP